jgi:hypothetical protein
MTLSQRNSLKQVAERLIEAVNKHILLPDGDMG